MTSSHVQLHALDNLCVATSDLANGFRLRLAQGEITLREAIGRGHKVAICEIRRGEPVRKFGEVIGSATADIAPGELIHSHNLANGSVAGDFERATVRPPVPPLPADLRDRSFLGYRRADGHVGTRNYIGVISTVNCSATVCKLIAERFDKSILRDYPSIDGVVAFRHDTGCGMQFGGMKHEYLNRVLGGIARHPNIGAFLIIGLGCEQGSIGHLLAQQNLVQIDSVDEVWSAVGLHGPPQSDRPTMPFVMSMQDIGGTRKTVEEGIRRIGEILPRANAVKRVCIPASEIVLGTNCGGSDGQSGITSNAALGVASDLLVAAGGTSILAETPEIYGAEHLLTRRARTPEVADKLLERIRWWKWYTGIFGADMDNNPSVGNKEGGLTTIAEKSLGAVAKAGSTAMNEVYEYAQPVTQRGMVVMDTPGFDPPSVTGIVAGGANVVVFTTGRGSCFGCKPTPSIKVASNTPMYERMIDDMDIDAGRIVSAGTSVEEIGREIYEKILAVASGEKTKSESQGLGDEEFVPWTPGPVL